MDKDSEIRKKQAEVAALRDEAARIVGAASTQGRELTTEDDARQEHLAVRRLRRKRLLRPAAPISDVWQANQEWSANFLMDGLASGRAIRVLTVVDNYTRECLAIEVDSCLSSRRVTRVLEWIIQQRGSPAAIRCDNGPKFYQPALFDMVRKTPHPAGPHSAGPTDAEWTGGKLQWAATR